MCMHGHHKSKVQVGAKSLLKLMCVLCVTDAKPPRRCTAGTYKPRSGTTRDALSCCEHCIKRHGASTSGELLSIFAELPRLGRMIIHLSGEAHRCVRLICSTCDSESSH